MDFSNRDLSPDEMLHIGEQKVLRSLHMPRNTTDDDLRLLRGLTVSYLSLSYSKVQGPGLVHLADVHDIRNLSLAWTSLDDAGLAYLPRIDTVRILGLSDTRITDAGVKALFANGFHELEDLSIQDTSIGDKAVAELADLKHLKSLNVYHTRVSGGSLSTVEAMAELEFFACGLSRISAAGVARLNANRPLLKVDYGD